LGVGLIAENGKGAGNFLLLGRCVPRGMKGVDGGDFEAISICEPFLIVPVIPRVANFKD
jgi:hypothetical protein